MAILFLPLNLLNVGFPWQELQRRFSSRTYALRRPAVQKISMNIKCSLDIAHKNLY
jgi:hypothetical protein